MQFLSRQEAGILEKKLRRQLGSVDEPKAVLYYTSGRRDYAPAARLIAAAAGDFSEAAILFSFCVTGDGWNQHTSPESGWPAYRQWRSSFGEERRLHDAPGHLFGRGESDQFSRVIEFALILGWDVLVGAKPGRNQLFLSHDDRLEIFAGFEARGLTKKLLALGYWNS
jgi:hypothetical protein